MNTAINIFNAVWPFIVLGGGATAFTQIAKRLTKLENNAVIRFLFHSVVVVITFLTYLLGSHALSLPTLILHGGAISGFAAALYPIVKWLDIWFVKLNKALQVVNQDLPQAEQIVNTVATSGTSTAGSNTTATTQNTNNTPPPANF